MSTKDIVNSVMEKIENKEVKMRPKWHFTLLTTSLVAGIVSLGVVAGYAIRIILINVTIASSSTPRYGLRQQLAEMTSNLPIEATLIAVAAIALLIYLIKAKSELYKYKLRWIILGAITLSIIVGILFTLILPGHMENRGEGSQQHTPRGKRIQKQ